jgi:hypothetical protein
MRIALIVGAVLYGLAALVAFLYLLAITAYARSLVLDHLTWRDVRISAVVALCWWLVFF